MSDKGTLLVSGTTGEAAFGIKGDLEQEAWQPPDPADPAGLSWSSAGQWRWWLL